jgi:purine-binding chemotaxis protein CheW
MADKKQAVDFSTNTRNATACNDLAGKYLTFDLCGEEYGLEILKVQEIIGMMSVTHVPKAPQFIRGVINLRGKVIPVVDLRVKFGMAATEDTEKTCVIVVQVSQGDRQVTMGTIVDEVREVLDVKGEQIEPSPEFGEGTNTDFILGMGKVADKVIMLLDVDKVLSDGETHQLGSLLETEAA